MTWAEVLADPCLQDLPYKIELNGRGEIIMSPAANWHGRHQVRIGALLTQLTRGGETISECSVETDDGVKVPDVAWLSARFVRRVGLVTPLPEAPEICVEVVSPSNSRAAIAEKARLYFNRGAVEVWTCNKAGAMRFLGLNGALDRSRLVPKFPMKV